MPEKMEPKRERGAENVVITNADKFEAIEKKFQTGGFGKIHILADFDKTLTKAYFKGQEVPSTISVLRDGNYLTPDYAAEAHALYAKYRPLEKDPALSKAEKKKLMEEWWRTHFELLLRSGLRREDVARAVASEKICFRDGFQEFSEFLRQHNVPLVIMSASGLGKEAITQKLGSAGADMRNIFIIANEFEWDADGNIAGIKEPIVHSANKDETVVHDFPEISAVIRNRPNVILLGDGLHDVEMVEGFDFENLLKVGFYNENDGEHEAEYRQAYDVLITNDASLAFVNKFLKKLEK